MTEWQAIERLCIPSSRLLKSRRHNTSWHGHNSQGCQYKERKDFVSNRDRVGVAISNGRQGILAFAVISYAAAMHS